MDLPKLVLANGEPQFRPTDAPPPYVIKDFDSDKVYAWDDATSGWLEVDMDSMASMDHALKMMGRT